MCKLVSCEFNIDTACVELLFADSSMISTDCIAVENEVAEDRFDRGGFDFSKPPRYHWGVKRCLLHDVFFLLPSCGRCLKQRMELTF